MILLIGRYIEYEKDGKGKEYSYDYLVYEGEYLNGKKWNGIIYNKINNSSFIIKNGNGKGKEYNFHHELKYEGEFINGERNGKGKEYYYNGKLKFEGEYLNGKKWNGKGYDNMNK